MFSSKTSKIFFGKKFFSTVKDSNKGSDKELLKRVKINVIIRTSEYEPRANELITALEKKDYNKAYDLVTYEKVNVNGHNRGEDTPLTKLAANGDKEGVKY